MFKASKILVILAELKHQMSGVIKMAANTVTTNSQTRLAIDELSNKIDKLEQLHVKNYNDLVKEFLAYTINQNNAITRPLVTVKPTLNTFAELGMFEELPVGDAGGYKTHELQLGDNFEG